MIKQTVGVTNSARFRCLEGLERGTIDLSLLYCGIERTNPGHRFGPNKRDSYVLHILLEGQGKLEINRHVYYLNKHSAFLIAQGEEAYYEADFEDPWTYMWVGISGIMSKQTAEYAGFTVRKPIRGIDENRIPRLRSLLEQMLETYQLTYSNELRRSSILLDFFAELIDEYNETRGQQIKYDYPISVYIKQAVDYMNHHYDDKIQVKEVADYIGINRCYLSNGFKQIYGMSPKQYLMDLRVKKAAVLIKQSSESIKAIAKSVGYDDPLAFSKIFRQEMGVSPRQYRNREVELIEWDVKREYVF